MPLFGPPNVEKMKAKGDVKGLIKALGYKKDASIRQAAAQALLQMGQVRDVVAALSKMEDALGVELLTANLKDGDWRVRRGAAEALGKLGYTHAMDSLVEALEDKSVRVRQAAATALKRLGWQPDDGRSGAHYWAMHGQWDKCVKIGPAAVEPLIRVLKVEKMGEEAARALGRIADRRAVQPLIARLRDTAIRERTKGPDTYGVDATAGLRRAAAEALGVIGDPRVIQRLLVALEDRDGDVCQAAQEALMRITDRGAVDPLVEALTLKGETWRARRIAAEALVALYRSGELDEQSRKKILAQRRRMARPHKDTRQWSEEGCAYYRHTDSGIGVKFKL